MSITIRDIARALKVDPSTVSSCLSGDYRKRRISASRAEEVRRKAAEMGYIPNQLAGRIFRRNRRKNIALIFKNDTAGTRNLPVLDYAIRTLGERSDCDFSVLYARSSDLTDALKNGIGLGISDFVVIGYMRGLDFAKIDFAKLPEIRIFAADYFFDQTDFKVPFLCSKSGFNRDIFYQTLSSFLQSNGLGPVVEAHSLEQGQEPIPNSIFYRPDEINDLFEFGKNKIAPLIAEKIHAGKCRTILLRNDSLAVGVMETLLSQGIRIPDDLAVIGFNNAPFSAYTKVALSSVGIPVMENIRMILAHLLDGAALAPVMEQKPALYLRQSTPAALRQAKPPEYFRIIQA